MLHRTRALLMRQRIMVVNALRGHLAEFGLIAPQGAKGLADLLERTFRPDGTGPIPSLARAALAPLVSQVRQLQAAHQGDRRGASGLGIALECRQPKVGDDPGHRVHHGNRHRGNRDGPLPLPVGAAVRGLAGPRSPPESPAAARSASDRSLRWATDICERFSLSGPRPSSATRVARTRPVPRGSTGFWRGAQRALSRWPSPIRRRGSHGRF